MQTEWNKHQAFATRELKQGLLSYCDIASYHLRVQTAIVEKLQVNVDVSLQLQCLSLIFFVELR